MLLCSNKSLSQQLNDMKAKLFRLVHYIECETLLPECEDIRFREVLFDSNIPGAK